MTENAMTFHEQGSGPWENARSLTETFEDALNQMGTGFNGRGDDTAEDGESGGSSASDDDDCEEVLEMARAEVDSEQQLKAGLQEPAAKRVRLDAGWCLEGTAFLFLARSGRYIRLRRALE